MIIGLEKTENIVLHKVNWPKDGNMIGHRMSILACLILSEGKMERDSQASPVC